ncbi:DoxX family protein [Terrimonas pollutisoli]|uniref:DoxX family protein n=1 Tax=Terrimonas pollutisoli TaxID=3034147 RepID=UPI0023EB048F|nr:DoxX family protein [Terrimonas sp. H1YJ31]
MDLLHRLEYWGERHHPRWMDIIRIALGIFLVYKGIDFLYNMSDLVSLMSIKTSFGSFAYILIGHIIVFAHILGGIFLVLGVLTRFACLIQIPILLGAVFLINMPGDAMKPYSELLISIIVLLLLIYFLIAGNGPLSVKLEEPAKAHK